MGFFSPQQSSSTQTSGLRSWGDAGNLMVERLGGDYGYVQDQAKSLYNNPGSLQMDRMGFFTNPDGSSPVANAFQQAVAQGWNGASGNAAKRGQFSPMNLEGVSGSAAQNVMPQFMPIINQNALQAQQYGKQNQFAALGLMNQNLNTAGGMLGSQGTSGSTGPGLGYDAVQQFNKNSMQWFSPEGAKQGAALGAFCWIAEVLYGKGSKTVAILRDWLGNVAPRLSEGYRQFAMWYSANGQEVAAAIKKNPDLRRAWKPLFDLFLADALEAQFSRGSVAAA